MCFMCDIFTLSNLCICDLVMFRLFRKGTSNSVFIFFLRITNAFFFVVVAKSPTKQKKKTKSQERSRKCCLATGELAAMVTPHLSTSSLNKQKRDVERQSPSAA